MAPERVIVIGGGLAGLTAALHIAERGLTPLILEADPIRPGGRVSGGDPVRLPPNWVFPGEHGIHAIWGQYYNFRAFVARHKIAPGYIPARREWWVHRPTNGRVQWAEGGSALRTSWIPAPFHYLALFVRPRFLQMLTLRDLASMFRVLSGLWFALAFDPAAGDDALRQLTLADYFRGWSPTLQALFAGLARNFASAHPDQVPQSGFIAFLRFYTLLRRDSWAFTYFDRDAGRALIDPLVDRLHTLGGEIQLGARVTNLTRQGDCWNVAWSDGQATAPHIILALDAPGARILLESSPDTASTAESLTWPLTIPTAVLRFWFKTAPHVRAEAGICTGDFTIDNFFWLDRFQPEFSAWREATGGGVVETHIYGPSETLAQPDAVLLARALVDVQRIWPAVRGEMLAQSIRRNPATHTLFGTAGSSLGVETAWPDMVACGDWVRFPHPSLYLERAVVTGIAAANRVLQAHNLDVWPIRAPDRPELLARAIQAALRRVRHLAGNAHPV
ncbi:MAG: FAD-dependent oxidoreductase [Aggregatilineales bacterium]